MFILSRYVAAVWIQTICDWGGCVHANFKCWSLYNLGKRQPFPLLILIRYLSGLRVSWQYQLSVYVLCLTVLLTVTGNNGAGILQLSRPTTLVSEKSCCSTWEIVIFHNREVKILMVFRYLQELSEIPKEAVWVIPFYGSVCLEL